MSLDELIARTDIVMLPPPIPGGRDRSVRGQTDFTALRAEIASLKRERDERAADDHISRLCQKTAEPLPITAGEWQGETPGSSASTPARNR